jgi:2-keto-3-deoxy-L-rhamnonate aldolase RhmA
MQKNSVKERLKAGECVYGTSLEDCLDPEMAVVLAAAGLDFFFVDTEHCTASYAQIQQLCRAGRSAGLVPLVRVPQNESHLLSRTADMGPMGIIVPRVHSAEEAKAAIKALKFPPLGQRGFGLRSTITDLRSPSAAQEIESCNQETLVVLMIESKQGLSSVEDIAAVPGVDALFIGPYDLTLSLGIIEQFDNPLFWQSVDRVFKAAATNGIAAGLQTGKMDLLLEARKRGGRFLMYSSDTGVLFNGYKEAMTKLKAAAPSTRASY